MQRHLRILNNFSEKLRKTFPEARVWLFGSYAKGEETSESDLDVCVVLPEIKREDRLAISDIAWEVGLSYDIHISTIVISQSNFEHGPVSSSSLIHAIRTEGVAA
jgi:uncharacterized protein